MYIFRIIQDNYYPFFNDNLNKDFYVDYNKIYNMILKSILRTLIVQQIKLNVREIMNLFVILSQKEKRWII